MLYKVPNAHRNQSVTQICEADVKASSLYVRADDAAMAKDNQLSNHLYHSLANPEIPLSNLQLCFRPSGNVATGVDIMPTFIGEIQDQFALQRIKWIKVILTPQMYLGIGPSSVSGNDSIHPILHYINDDGTSAKTLRPDGLILSIMSIEDAQRLNGYGQRFFDGPIEFKINPNERFFPTNETQKQDKLYTSYRTWTRCGEVDPPSGGSSNNPASVYIPNDNFFFGFSNIPTDFKYTVNVIACVEYKHLKVTV